MKEHINIRQIWDKTNNKMVGILFITFLLVYFSPSVTITRVLFFGILFSIFRSKNDYFWLAWFFIVVDAPGHLFSGGTLADIQRIPIYPIVPSFTISFFDLFILVYFVKAILKRKVKTINFFNTQISLFIALFLFYCVFTVSVFQLEFVKFYRTISPWVLVYVVFVFMREEESFHRFNKLVFPIVFLAVLAQIYSIIEGQHVVNIFKNVYQVKSHLSREITEDSINAARNLYSMFIIFYSIIMAFFNLAKKKLEFPEKYLIFVIFTSFLSVVLSGTRGFLLAVGFIIFCSILLVLKKSVAMKYLKMIVILSMFTYLLIYISPSIRTQLKLVTERYETMSMLAEGDVTMKDSLARVTIRIPRIMKWIEKSAVFGYGFSDIYYNNADNDIGFFTVMLNVGILGTVLLYLLFLSILIKINKISSSESYKVLYKKGGKVFFIGLIGLMIFHLTTNITFGFTPSANFALHERYLIYGLLFSCFNITAYNAFQRMKLLY